MTDLPPPSDPSRLLAERMAHIANSARTSNLARVDKLDAWIEAGLPEHERVEEADIAHKLAGSAGTFGYTRVSERARDLELYLTSETSERQPADLDPERMREWVRELRQLLAEEPDELD